MHRQRAGDDIERRVRQALAKCAGGNTVTLPRLGTLRTFESTEKLAALVRDGKARILSATVSRTAQRWLVSFSVALADLAIGKVRAKRKELADALDGKSEAHHAELARILLDQIDALTRQAVQLSARADELIAQIPAAQGIDADGTTGPDAGRGRTRARHAAPGRQLRRCRCRCPVHPAGPEPSPVSPFIRRLT